MAKRMSLYATESDCVSSSLANNCFVVLFQLITSSKPRVHNVAKRGRFTYRFWCMATIGNTISYIWMTCSTNIWFVSLFSKDFSPGFQIKIRCNLGRKQQPNQSRIGWPNDRWWGTVGTLFDTINASSPCNQRSDQTSMNNKMYSL